MGAPVFRGYDQAALDRQYDNRAKVQEAPAYLERWPRESAATRAELPCRLDVPYGPHPGETLDIFLPRGGWLPRGGRPAAEGGRAPVQVFIHGGYWRALGKRDFSYVARAFHPAGAAVVVIDYALIPSVDMTELVRQCRAAVAWVHRHADSFGGDRERLFVSGHSAGGHLAAMLMATDWRALDGLPADVVKGGAGISGLYDLEPIRLSYLNDTLKLAPDDIRRSSPVHLVPPRPAPLLLAVGELEGPEYYRQTDDLAAAWRRHGVACDVRHMAGLDHFSIATQLETPTSDLSRAILRQMGP